MSNNREFGLKIQFDFGIIVFTIVGIRNAEYKSAFLVKFISVAEEYSHKHMAFLNGPLKSGAPNGSVP